MRIVLMTDPRCWIYLLKMADHVFCLAEDRPFAETGLRLLLLSIHRHAPETPTVLWRPGASPEFTNWLRQFPKVRWLDEWPKDAMDWNCKPHAMLPFLDEGFRRVTWLDSDLMLFRPVKKLLEDLNEETILIARDSPSLVAGEYTLGSRTSAWGWPIHRNLPMTLNTCFFSVTSKHKPLLLEWQQLLQSPKYLHYTRTPLESRPPGFISDQEVLSALLGGPKYADIPLRVLQTGSELVHCAGARSFSLADRWRWIRHGPPYAIHSTTGKPWALLRRKPGEPRRKILTKLALQTSPYVASARSYRRELGEEAPWLDFFTFGGRFLKICGLGNHALQGLPLTLFATLIDAAYRVRRLISSQPTKISHEQKPRP